MYNVCVACLSWDLQPGWTCWPLVLQQVPPAPTVMSVSLIFVSFSFSLRFDFPKKLETFPLAAQAWLVERWGRKLGPGQRLKKDPAFSVEMSSPVLHIVFTLKCFSHTYRDQFGWVQLLGPAASSVTCCPAFKVLALLSLASALFCWVHSFRWPFGVLMELHMLKEIHVLKLPFLP